MRFKTPTIVALALMAFTAAAPAQDMTVWQARRALMTNVSLAQVQQTQFKIYNVIPSSLRINEQGFEFDTTLLNGKPAEHYSAVFADLRGAKLVCHKGWQCALAIGDEKKPPAGVPRLMWNDTHRKYTCSAWCEQQATTFIAALNRLADFAVDTANPLHDFPSHAEAWRVLAKKPPLPDPVRIRAALAEDAVRSQKPADALKYYQQGLEFYALWPEGWYNAALISGALGDYDGAIEFMQNYLLLVPNAADASAAHDQLEMWKIKAKEKN